AGRPARVLRERPHRDAAPGRLRRFGRAVRERVLPDAGDRPVPCLDDDRARADPARPDEERVEALPGADDPRRGPPGARLHDLWSRERRSPRADDGVRSGLRRLRRGGRRAPARRRGHAEARADLARRLGEPPLLPLGPLVRRPPRQPDEIPPVLPSAVLPARPPDGGPVPPPLAPRPGAPLPPPA